MTPAERNAVESAAADAASTPRTDAFYAEHLKMVGRIAIKQPSPTEWCEFARQLERELAEAKETIFQLRRGQHDRS